MNLERTKITKEEELYDMENGEVLEYMGHLYIKTDVAKVEKRLIVRLFDGFGLWIDETEKVKKVEKAKCVTEEYR